ncbi:MAG: PEP-CTERM sorting domain-containing protein [Akkermansia muciniphila]|nr:PEP-CTERM sorting domain-containing protein [Akkermansia muciniphila]
MKPHLPLALLAALMLAAPARAIEIPSDYTTVYVFSTDDLTDYISNTSADKNALALYTDVDFTPTTNTTWTSSKPLVTGGNLIFTTAEGFDPFALSFKSGASSVFEQPASLTFDTLSKLELSSHSGGNDGAAIDLGTSGTLQISNVGTGSTAGTDAVLFSGNKVSATGTRSGGAIYAGDSSSISMSNNGGVAFRTNTYTTTSSSSAVRGGAIYSGGAIQMKGNSSVTFQGNEAQKTTFSSSYYSTAAYFAAGGSLYGNIVEISQNGDVVFSGNSASDAGYCAYGGAIYSRGKITFDDNESISFTENKAVSFQGKVSSFYTGGAYGGALYGMGGVEITGTTGVVQFSGNNASGYYFGYGGAIYSRDGAVKLRNNASVVFSGNKALTSGNYQECAGGAIYSAAGVSITGNESVLFEKNYEKKNYGDIARFSLRSIYNTLGTFALAAKTGGSIIFNDSVYHSGSTVSFNADYEDATGVTQKATGDIIFSGKYTEEHLAEMKGSAGTSSEITDSRTSYIGSLITLYGGSLQVVDGAILNGKGLTVAENSQATLLLRNGSMSHSGSNFTFNSTSELKLEGTNTITASKVTLGRGSALTVSLGQEHLNTAALALGGTDLATSQLAVNLERTDGLTSGMFKIISQTSTSDFTTSSAWKADNVSVNGSGYANRATFRDLVWQNGTLYYQVGRNIWSNTSGDCLWNTSSDNWTMNERSYTYLDGMDVSFTDTGAGEVKLVGDVAPASIIVNNSEGNNYSLVAADGGGRLTGSTGITKEGTGELSITTANVHTGATVLNGGTLRVQHSTALGATAEGGTATVSTAAGTTLSVENNSHLVLAGVNDIKGAVEVAEGATLEMRNAGYASSDSTVNGVLHFRGAAADTSNAGSLDGSGSVKVEDSHVTFGSQSGFTGNVSVKGDGASLSIASGNYSGAGKISVSGSGAVLKMGDTSTKCNMTLTNGGELQISSDGTTPASVSLNNLIVSTGATLSALSLMTDSVSLAESPVTLAEDAPVFNAAKVGTVTAAQATLMFGSTYQADGGHLSLGGGILTLALTTQTQPKINLLLTVNGGYTTGSRVLLFSDVNKVNFSYDNEHPEYAADGGLYSYTASKYFTGNWIGENTNLVYDSAARTVYVENVVNYTVPEPATATLSLLGLAALLGRRRRKR